MKVTIELVKAFSKDKGLGNPAGVVHDANQLSDVQMLKIAQVLGFSESAFIQNSDTADFRVRFFAPKEEVEFCGHATVATFHALVEKGTIAIRNNPTTVTQETNAGIFEVNCYSDGKIMMAQGSATFGEIEQDKDKIAELLNINKAELSELPIQIVGTVTPALMVPVSSLSTLRKVQPNLAAISTYSEQKAIGGLYLFTAESLSGNSDMCTRSFDPLVGIDEDAATGVAAGPLGGYADKYIYKGNKKQFVIEQGFDMGKTSTIYVDISGKVLVGGYATSFGHKQLET